MLLCGVWKSSSIRTGGSGRTMVGGICCERWSCKSSCKTGLRGGEKGWNSEWRGPWGDEDRFRVRVVHSNWWEDGGIATDDDRGVFKALRPNTDEISEGELREGMCGWGQKQEDVGEGREINTQVGGLGDEWGLDGCGGYCVKLESLNPWVKLLKEWTGEDGDWDNDPWFSLLCLSFSARAALFLSRYQACLEFFCGVGVVGILVDEVQLVGVDGDDWLEGEWPSEGEGVKGGVPSWDAAAEWGWEGSCRIPCSLLWPGSILMSAKEEERSQIYNILKIRLKLKHP